MKAKTVVVTGDFTLDWNLARNPRLAPQRGLWEPDVWTRLRWQRGGAGLLADLVRGVVAGIRTRAEYELLEPQTPRRLETGIGQAIDSEDPRYHHSYASWKLFDYAAKGTQTAKWKEKQAWRVEDFMGARRAAAEGRRDWARVLNDDADAQIVVLDDANLGFRDDPTLWPDALSAGSKPWVLVKMSRPVAHGPLWDHLCKHHSGKLIAMMTVNDLRLTEVEISRALSWERTAQDLVWELAYNSALGSLKKCAHVVVSFNADGAFLCSRESEAEARYSLLFDPEGIEGAWERSYPGRMVGYSSCLAAGIVRELMLEPENPVMQKGICSGLWALRCLHREGYGQRGASAEDVTIEFPVNQVTGALEAEEAACGTRDELESGIQTRGKVGPFRETAVPAQMSESFWSILADQCKGNLEQRATEVVLFGPKEKLASVPLGRFNNLLTVDRQEIESLRTIGSLVSEYVAHPRPESPLSIAVFGPPGSGKSFGIKQLALSLRPGEIEIREFNLSQFRSFEELLAAFHQVRDIGLTGKLPLIFWDEFDSDFEGSYGWLKYFLAPMQDGMFQQGGMSHPIGKAIFVFAGGTSSTLDGFGKNGDENSLRAAKVPDFVSRLKGYLNVLGPNVRRDVDDPYYVLRRAILLRSMLERGAPHLQRNGKLEIDEGVLRALLLTRTYKHGARSMKSIIDMSELDGRIRFERSCLPARAQLDLHVDGRSFLALVHQLKFDDETVERMAKVAHRVNFELQEALEEKKRAASGEAGTNSLSMIPFEQLGADKQEQNRGQVRDIPAKLALAGCTIVRTREGDRPFVFTPETLDLLASKEHTRWLRLKVSEGFSYADETDGDNRLHKCMLPWRKGELSDYAGFADRLGPEELSQEEKDKDRAAVKGIARILNETGYTVAGE